MNKTYIAILKGGPADGERKTMNTAWPKLAILGDLEDRRIEVDEDGDPVYRYPTHYYKRTTKLGTATTELVYDHIGTEPKAFTSSWWDYIGESEPEGEGPTS